MNSPSRTWVISRGGMTVEQISGPELPDDGTEVEVIPVVRAEELEAERDREAADRVTNANRAIEVSIAADKHLAEREKAEAERETWKAAARREAGVIAKLANRVDGAEAEREQAFSSLDIAAKQRDKVNAKLDEVEVIHVADVQKLEAEDGFEFCDNCERPARESELETTWCRDAESGEQVDARICTACRERSNFEERLLEKALDEPAISAAESAYKATLPAANDPNDDTGWAEPMTEAVQAALRFAFDQLSDEAIAASENPESTEEGTL
jgi:hypothetical protein